MKRVLFYVSIVLAVWFVCKHARSQTSVMQLPKEVRQWYDNPDGSCVQCSIGMVGVWANVPAASTLLWDTPYGPAERGGSWPSRVAEYCNRRGIPAYNVTGDSSLVWLEWAAKTGRFAGTTAGVAHFQTFYGRAPGRWYVCDNNSPHVVHSYTREEFYRLHSRAGLWVVILDTPAPPAVPVYRQWW